ncbi:hypothetical protein CDAR_102401 [Caerostris darwini]|uniref:Uncharacterized protein n=1 Tax=Caerostris darwini TaxID=1538125 RepID=A0AAV4PV31_9ARAC|nr:hypothetical protein CDAR_102401 [Caerostris darwini]
MGAVTVRKDFREDHMRGVTDEKVQFLLFLVSSFLLRFGFLSTLMAGYFSEWKGDLPHFKSPDNVGRGQQARDKEISSYHLNLQSEGS